MTRKFIICGTGHRPDKLGGYMWDGSMNSIASIKLHEIACEWLKLHKPTLVIVGMAMGWDMILAQACITLGIPFHAYVPFKGQERMWSKEVQDYYWYLIDHAELVKIICDGDYSPKKMQIRNEAMVNDSIAVLSMWDGSDGGTGNCIRYAEKKGKTIINLYDQWKQ